jgi:uncharacterized protein YyaL (SSP411 family)
VLRDPVPDGAAVTTTAARSVEAWRALTAVATRVADGRLEVHDGLGRSAGPVAVWALGQVLSAAMAVAGLQDPPSTTTVDALRATLARYRVGRAYAPFPGDRSLYYDDNAWIGLALAQWSGQLADAGRAAEAAAALAEARELLATLAEGEAPGGGIRWRAGDPSVNTCATGPTAELALRVHQRTGDGEALELARRCRSFLAVMLRRGDRLYADHVDGAGRVEPTIWSYNQGTPLGADVLWAAATGDRRALDDAEATAHAALRHLRRDDRLWSQPPVFNAVLFRNLLALHAARPDPAYLDALDGYLDRAWAEARDRRTGLLTAGGIGSYDRRPTIDQAGLVQLYALRSWPPARWPQIA